MLHRGLCLLLAGVVVGTSPPALASPASPDDPGPRGWPAELKAKRDEVLALHNLGLDTTRAPAERADAILRAQQLAREQVQVGPGSYRRKMAEETKLLAETHYTLTGEVESLCAALELVRGFLMMSELAHGAGPRWSEAMQAEQSRIEDVARKAGAACVGTPEASETDQPEQKADPEVRGQRPEPAPGRLAGPAPTPRLDPPPSRVRNAVGWSLVGAGAAFVGGTATCLALGARENASIEALEAELARTGQPLSPEQHEVAGEANARHVGLTAAGITLGTLAVAALIAGGVVLATRQRGRPARAARLRHQAAGVQFRF